MILFDPLVWVLRILFFDQLQNLFSGLVPIHSWHLDVHENKLVASIQAPTLFLKRILELFYRDVTVLGFFYCDHLIFALDKLD